MTLMHPKRVTMIINTEADPTTTIPPQGATQTTARAVAVMAARDLEAPEASVALELDTEEETDRGAPAASAMSKEAVEAREQARREIHRERPAIGELIPRQCVNVSVCVCVCV